MFAGRQLMHMDERKTIRAVVGRCVKKRALNLTDYIKITINLNFQLSQILMKFLRNMIKCCVFIMTSSIF